MPERWDLVADAITARMRELRLTQADLKRKSGVSQTSLTGYLRGEPIRRLDKRWAICEALRWTSDSIDQLLAGQEPQEDGHQPRDDLASIAEDVADLKVGMVQLADKVELLLEVVGGNIAAIRTSSQAEAGAGPRSTGRTRR